MKSSTPTLYFDQELPISREHVSRMRNQALSHWMRQMMDRLFGVKAGHCRKTRP